MSNIFSYRSPEAKKERLHRVFAAVGAGVAIIAVAVTIIALAVSHKNAETPQGAEVGEREPTIAEIIAELNVSTARDFSTGEAEALAARIETEWLPRANDKEKVRLYEIEAHIFDRANMPGRAAVSLVLALPLADRDTRRDLYERLYSLYLRADDKAKAKQYAISVVESMPESDNYGRAAWQKLVDGLAAEGF